MGLRFESLERLGLAAAAISDLTDGNCSEPAARARFCSGLGLDAADMARGCQVHGVEVAVVDGSDRGLLRPDTDGLITGAPGLPLGVLVADCVPVYLFDPARRVAGLVHAGREGTRAGVCVAAVRLMVEQFGCAAQRIMAVVGPSAGPCCYKVCDAMAGEFRSLGFPVEGRRLNLWASNAAQLTRAGVLRKNIEQTGLCTICGGRFFSYRRGDANRRNLAVICL